MSQTPQPFLSQLSIYDGRIEPCGPEQKMNGRRIVSVDHEGESLTKVSPREMTDFDFERFAREYLLVQVLGDLAPTVRLLALDTDSVPFVLLAPGMPTHLSRYVDGDPPKRNVIGERLKVFASLCQAVAGFHEAGICHLDLRPHWIQYDDAGNVRISHWRRTRVMPHCSDESLTRFRDAEPLPFEGLLSCFEDNPSPGYLAPEIMTGGTGTPLDERSDVYALGSILYALVCGRPICENDDVDTYASIATSEDFPALTTLMGNGKRFRAIDAICRRAMSYEREERYPDAGELCDALDTLVDCGWDLQ